MRRMLLRSPLLAVLLAQVPQGTIWLKPSDRVTWDPVVQDVAGNPEQVGSYEVAITPTTVDLRPRGSDWINIVRGVDASVPADSGFVIAPLTVGLKPGRYRIFVRAVDLAGNDSEWSDPFEHGFDDLPPKKPSAVRRGG